MTGETDIESESEEKLSLIERLGRTFDSLIRREFGKRFYSESFLNELVERKSSVDGEMNKSAGVTMFFAAIIVFFDLVSGNFNVGSGLSISLTRDVSPVLCFMAASALLRTVLLFIDILVINQILVRIAQNIGVSSMNLILINRRAIGIWSDALVPTYFGVRSGRGHHIAFSFVGILFIFLMSIMMLFPSLAIIISVIDIYNSDVRWLAKMISFLSAFMLVLIFALIICFSVRYSFLPAEFDEVTYEPTDRLKKELQRKFAAENAGGEASA